MDMALRICVCLAVVAIASSYPQYQPEYPEAPPQYYPEPEYASPAKYGFDYAVRDDYTGVDFAHNEIRDGYQTTGQYYVHLPDGRVQKVVYTVDDKTGYIADVQYEGEAQFPDEPYPKQPAYAQPTQPTYSSYQ